MWIRHKVVVDALGLLWGKNGYFVKVKLVSLYSFITGCWVSGFWV